MLLVILLFICLPLAVSSALGESTFLFLSSFSFFILGQIHLGWSNIAFSSFSLYVKIFILPIGDFMVNHKLDINSSLFLLQFLARRFIFGKGYATVGVETHGNRKKVNKFKESAWKCVYFLCAEILALYVSYDEPWFTNTKYFWVGPGDQVWPDQKLK